MAQIILAEQATPPNPPADSFALFFDESDSLLKYVESDGTVVTIGAGAGITTLTGDVTAGPGSGSVASSVEALQGNPLTITDPASGDVLEWNGEAFVNTPNSGGGVASLSGAGVTESPGILDQNGGMNINDTEGDGFVVATTGELQFTSNSESGIALAAPQSGIILSGSAFGFNGNGVKIGQNNNTFLPVQGSGPDFPYTVVTGVNDTLTYTPVSTGTPDVFTVAPGVYASAAELASAIDAAIDADDATFPANCQALGNVLYCFGPPPGDTITPGPTDLMVAVFDTDLLTETLTTDFIGFMGSNPVEQQTVTGSLSTVVDPAAQAVLTSIIAALKTGTGYGLVIDGTS